METQLLNTGMRISSSIRNFDTIVLGAGVSGLTVAYELSSRGNHVALLDDYSEPGGNHLSYNVGPYTFDIGAIFFWSDNPLFSMFPGIDRECTSVDYVISRITPAGRVLKYPFDLYDELLCRRPAYIARVCTEIALRRLRPQRKQSAADYAAYHMGDRLLNDSGLSLYMERFYGIPADEISYSFAERRMRWVEQNATLGRAFRLAAAHFRRNDGPRNLSKRCLARPRRGFPVMYRHALRQLVASGVTPCLNAGLAAAIRKHEQFEVHTAGGPSFAAPRLLSTVPLVKTAALFGQEVDQKPESATLTTLFCRFSGERNFDSVVLYNFSKRGAWKRLTMHSDYYGAVDEWEYLAVEVTSRERHVPSDVVLFDDLRSSTAGVGLFDGALELVGSMQTEFAYPVLDQSADDRRSSTLAGLHALGVEMIGRQGTFDYIPTSAQAVDQARRVLGAMDNRVSAPPSLDR